ncbi:Pentatricopeptide repeat [Dillenia turbinata]|uniref:Pentatricopeptide repeat n=1 Tax=Dillenia turbinata TaxID=194707 RepID=A0AAN8W8E3_9MAGN
MATISHTSHANQFKLHNSPNRNSTPKSQTKTLILCKKADKKQAWDEKKSAFVDYDKGKHEVRVEVSGLRKEDIPKRYRLKVEYDRFQKDWSISKVVERVVRLNHWDDIDGVLNQWIGRFSRKNFPVLIKPGDIIGIARPPLRKFSLGYYVSLHVQIPPSRSTYNSLINACGSSGNWKEALEICKKMTENGVGPDLVTHNSILSAYKNGAQYRKALSYFELMKGTNIHPNTITLNIVIHCHIKLGHNDKAVEIFNSMRQKRAECHPDIVTYTSIVHAYAVSGQIDSCKAVFNTMLAEGVKPNIVSYNALLGAYASQGMTKEANAVFNVIKQNGFQPDVVTYTSLLNAFGKSQQPEKAKEVFDLMKQNNWKPNIVSYNALIDAYGSNGLLAEAVEVLREMERDGIRPNVVSICTLLAACSRCSQRVNIDSILSAADMRGIELNTVAYNSAIGSYMNVGECEKAFTMYKSMRKKRVRPSSVTYNVLISGCCKTSRYDEALVFFDEMMDLKVPPSLEVYSSMICVYSKKGQLAEAESTFTRMKILGFNPDVVIYTAMLHAYNATENWEKAYELFQEMEINNIVPDTIACAALTKAFNRGCQPTKVLILAKIMRDKNIPFSDAVLFEMVMACSLVRDWKTATDLINMMEPSFPAISVGLLNQLLHFLGRSGKTDTMMKLFYKVLSSGAEITFYTYSILLKNLLGAGNWKKYIEVLQWMEDSGIRPSIAMYSDISFFAQHSGQDFAPLIQARIGIAMNCYNSIVLGERYITEKEAQKHIPWEVFCHASYVQLDEGAVLDQFSKLDPIVKGEKAEGVPDQVFSMRFKALIYPDFLQNFSNSNLIG